MWSLATTFDSEQAMLGEVLLRHFFIHHACGLIPYGTSNIPPSSISGDEE